MGLTLSATAPRPAEPERRPWPETLAAQVVAVRQAVAAGAGSAEAVAARFDDVRPAAVADVLDALLELNLVRSADGVLIA